MESEMLFILVLALIVLGPRKLPEIGRQIGRALAEFRRAKNEFARQIEDEIRRVDIEEKQTLTVSAVTSSATGGEAGGIAVPPLATAAQGGPSADVQDNRIKPPGQAPAETIASLSDASAPAAAAVAATQEHA